MAFGKHPLLPNSCVRLKFFNPRPITWLRYEPAPRMLPPNQGIPFDSVTGTKKASP